ncbi:MAG: SCO1664 family protein [Anaerolineae bacterium]|nr:SCO1664 family protein [Anaerolineae bacterium]
MPPEHLLDILQKGVVETEYGVMRWSSNYTFLLGLRHDNAEMMAVYKPQRGERPLWDFPDGTLCYREVAAFETSHELGWEIVPPTVLREGPHGIGSVQAYIDHDPEVNYFSFTEHMHPQLRRISAFDHLVNNADRKGGHCLIDRDGHLWGIDHGITFNVDHKLRTVIWDFAGQPLPEDMLADIQRLCTYLDDPSSDYRKKLDGLLDAREITAFQRRIQKMLHSGQFPQPGRGPNYPWPPV